MPKVRTGHIFQKEGHWYARFDYTDEAGRRRNKKRKAENKTAAKELLRQMLRQFEEHGPQLLDSQHITLSQYFDQWLETAAKPGLSERTHADYEALLQRYILPKLGRKKLSDLRALDIQALYTKMQEQGLSARTVRYTHTVLSAGLKQAVRWGMLAQNPAGLVGLPRQSRNEMRAFSPEEATRFLAAAAQDRWSVLFTFALETGTRPEEYFGLQWKDVDLQKGAIVIQRTLVWRTKGGGWRFDEPKTAKSRRTIPLSAPLIRALAEHRRAQAEERLEAGPEYQTLDLVFATSAGGPLSVQNLSVRHFKPILRRAGLPDTIRLYDLRHSMATLLLAAGENPKVVSERLGHSSVVLTLDTYSHVLPTMQQAATRKLEELLFVTEASAGRA